MVWIRQNMRQLRWQLTLSYTAVTVISLLVVMLIAAGFFFSAILLPDYVLSPQDWVDIAREQSQFPYGNLLAQEPPDLDVFTRILANFDPTIVSHRLFLFRDLEIYARTTGVIDVIFTDENGRLIGATHQNKPDLLAGIAPGESLDPARIPGLEEPLAAALQGRTIANAIFHQFEDRDGFVMAIPLFHPDRVNEVVGTIIFHVRDISTEDDRWAYFGIVLLRSLLVFLVVAGMVGATFGALTAEGLAGRFQRLASATKAWSQGDFSTRIREDSPDEIGQLAGRLDGMAQDLQELVHKRQELAVTQERSRLARDLHDSAKQLALAASLQIAAARRLFDRDPEAARAHLEEAENLADRVRTELTDLIHELRPVLMDGREFNEIVHTYAAEWAHASAISIEVDLQASEDLPLETEETLYRILQEALANVARHSGARQTMIQIAQHNGEIQLSVRDDGAGFERDSASRGMGLYSMQERAEAIGGFMRITSQPGAGTEVRVVLPLPRKEADDDGNHQRDAG